VRARFPVSRRLLHFDHQLEYLCFGLSFHRAEHFACADAPRVDARVQVGDAFHLDGAGDAKENDAVEPIVGDAVGRMYGDRNEVMLLPEPTVERERRLKYVAAS